MTLEFHHAARWVALSLMLPGRLTHAKIARKPITVGDRTYYVVNLRGPKDVDEDVRGLTEAYLAAP